MTTFIELLIVIGVTVAFLILAGLIVILVGPWVQMATHRYYYWCDKVAAKWKHRGD